MQSTNFFEKGVWELSLEINLASQSPCAVFFAWTATKGKILTDKFGLVLHV